jgi:hypothetical protein
MVSAKFKCDTVMFYENGGTEVKLRPVTSSGGNESWAKYTPSGDLRLYIDNPEASKQFTPGAVFYITFTNVQEIKEEV